MINLLKLSGLKSKVSSIIISRDHQRLQRRNIQTVPSRSRRLSLVWHPRGEWLLTIFGNKLRRRCDDGSWATLLYTPRRIKERNEEARIIWTYQARPNVYYPFQHHFSFAYPCHSVRHPHIWSSLPPRLFVVAAVTSRYCQPTYTPSAKCLNYS